MASVRTLELHTYLVTSSEFSASGHVLASCGSSRFSQGCKIEEKALDHDTRHTALNCASTRASSPILLPSNKGEPSLAQLRCS